jgi:cation transport ATPase
MRAKSIFAVPAGLSQADRQQRRHALVRLSLAWLAMMQVMMFAWPGYLRNDGIPADALETLDWAIVLMNWASFALTVPVVLYSAWPIWRHAGGNLRQGRAGMDVPVALGIVAAFIPSVHATYTGRGEVYFDSVTMFVAFLLTARYLELCARTSSRKAFSSGVNSRSMGIPQ